MEQLLLTQLGLQVGGAIVHKQCYCSVFLSNLACDTDLCRVSSVYATMNDVYTETFS